MNYNDMSFNELLDSGIDFFTVYSSFESYLDLDNIDTLTILDCLE